MPIISYTYSIPYIILALFMLLLYGIERRKISLGIKPKSAGSIAFWVMLLFIGLRGHIHSDWLLYYPYFERLGPLYDPSNFDLALFEPGFVIYSSIIKTIFPNYFAWVFINSLIDLIVFKYVFKKYTKSQVLPFFFFIAFNGLMIEFNLYRNMKAIDLFLLSLPYLQKRKILPYMALNLLGMTFHNSAAVYIPMYFILKMNIKPVICYTLIIGANILYLSQIFLSEPLMHLFSNFLNLEASDKMLRYISKGDTYIFGIGYIERTFAMILFTCLNKKFQQQSKTNIIFYNCYLFYYISMLVFADVQVFTERISYLFVFSYWILYTNLFYLKFNQKQILTIIIYMLAFIKIAASNKQLSAYYDNVIWGTLDYDQRKNNLINTFENSGQ